MLSIPRDVGWKCIKGALARGDIKQPRLNGPWPWIEK